MTTAKKLIAAAGAAAGEAVYVDDVFSTYLYTGNATARTITNGIDLAGEGGLVWIKDRSVSGQYNVLYDTERGANESLISDQTWAASSANGGVSAFNNDGFSINTYDDVNRNNSDLVSWTFRKQPGFFDIVTYTGNSQSVSGVNQTISHNLGTEPGMIIVKRTDGNRDWMVYHRSLGATKYLKLNSNIAEVTTDHAWVQTPTSTEFYVGQDYGVNGTNYEYVAYLFAHDAQDFGTDSDESIIKCGSYTTDGNEDATIDLGFEPQWLLVKRTDSNLASDWRIIDSMRGWEADGDAAYVEPNTTDAEAQTGDGRYYLTSTGFKQDNFGANRDYVYMAICRPHKPAEEFAATDLFAIASQTNNIPSFNAGFVVDMAFQKDINNTFSAQPLLTSRLLQGKYLTTSSTSAETSISNRDYDYNTGYSAGLGNNSTSLSWMFRRSPGFFDVVPYKSSTAISNIPHNLGAVPELVILKMRYRTGSSYGGDRWYVYHKDTGINAYLGLNQTNAVATHDGIFSSTPTSTNLPFSNPSNDSLATSDTQGLSSYVAYLFATVPGISKVGTYTGTGANVDVDCGFTSGARFVLVKRTDSTGDWYLWDSVRGIVAGNDPYLFLNSTAAQVTTTDYIDPLSSGFTITSSAPAALNASGGSYIFLAIA